MFRNNVFNIVYHQCRHIRIPKQREVNYRTRLIELKKGAQGKKPLEFRDEIDFSKVRCSLDSLKKTEKEDQKFPTDPDAPVELPFNPFEKTTRKCLLCELGVKLDYKNARLLQQFVSSFSGRVYDRHITGLCTKQHDNLLRTIAQSRRAGYMPSLVKDPKYLRDPKLFDPLKPIRPHSYDA